MSNIYLRLTPFEAAVGSAVGHSEKVSLPEASSDARATLEQLLEIEIRACSGPLCVMFSGGRDSSTVLAIATHVARRLGADDPLPVIARYPDDDRADETQWQDLVLAHLGLTAPTILSITAERRVLGVIARGHMVENGLVWPQAVQTQSVFFDAVGGGATLVTGEGGDVVLEAHRGTPIALLVAALPRPRGAHVRGAATALAPSILAEHRSRRTIAESMPWLRPSAVRSVARDAAMARGPLRWDAATRRVLRARANVLIDHNTQVGAAQHHVRLFHPLTDPRFVSALAREGGPRGFRGRTHVFRHLAADLLPDSILSRTSKAAFNASRWGEEERSFAASWDGTGLQEDVVDTGALRNHWLSERPHPITFTALQAAWLASEGLPLVPDAANGIAS